MKARCVAFQSPWVRDRLPLINKWWGLEIEWEYIDSDSPVEMAPFGEHQAQLDEPMINRWKGTGDFTLLVSPTSLTPKDYTGNLLTWGDNIPRTSLIGLQRPWDNVLEVFTNETDHTYVNEVDLGDTFTVFTNHEISHNLYYKTGLPDKTHLYFYGGNPEGARDELLKVLNKTMPPTVSEQPPVDIEHSDVLYPDWNTPAHARHNVRALCDLEGLTLDQKNTLTACVAVESGFDIHAINKNIAFHSDGTKYVASTDYGICQWNDYYHGKEITPTEALNNPEKAVRLMCRYWKQGLMRQWVSYSTNLYKHYL